MLQIRFENHLSLRVMEIHFPEGLALRDAAALQALKAAWTGGLKSWHSPYTCLFDCRKLELDPALRPDFERLVKFFGNFFMRKIVGFVDEGQEPRTDLPFAVIAGYDAAAKAAGLARGAGLKRDLGDLRQRIQIDNDFNAHVMEVSFLAETELAGAADVAVLKAKLQNILMQWHTPYSVMFNCVNLKFTPEAKQAFAPVERFLRGFFCQDVLGYAPVDAKENYPFPTYRARHLAAAKAEHQGLQSGAVANCSSRKSGPSGT